MSTLNPIKKMVEKKYEQRPAPNPELTVKTYIFIGCVIAMIIIGAVMWLQQNI